MTYVSRSSREAGARFRSLGFHGNSRERFSERGLIPPPYAGTTQSVNEVQIAANWELDFFGKNRENLKASLGELRATDAEYQATRMLLANQVARGYYNLARLLTLRDVEEQRSVQRSELAALTLRRFNAGIDTRVELESAQEVRSENARDIGSLDEQIALARHALAALIGQGPTAIDGLAPSLPTVTPLALPPALPADLLGHRADVAAARWRVESSLHSLESTRTLFYPNINLRAFAGFSAIGLENWIDAGSRRPGMSIAISLPLFDAGRLRNLYRGSAIAILLRRPRGCKRTCPHRKCAKVSQRKPLKTMGLLCAFFAPSRPGGRFSISSPTLRPGAAPSPRRYRRRRTASAGSRPGSPRPARSTRSRRPGGYAPPRR